MLLEGLLGPHNVMALQQVEEFLLADLARLHSADQRGQLLGIEAGRVEVAVDLIPHLARGRHPVAEQFERPGQGIANLDHRRGKDGILARPLDLRSAQRFGLRGFIGQHSRAKDSHALFERSQCLARFLQALA